MDGPKAFPGPSYTRSGTPNGHDMGMTLRDYFAGQALAGLCANMTEPDFLEMSTDHMASLSFKYADAMLKARELSQ